jgi:hypothetical protein
MLAVGRDDAPAFPLIRPFDRLRATFSPLGRRGSAALRPTPPRYRGRWFNKRIARETQPPRRAKRKRGAKGGASSPLRGEVVGEANR